MKIGKHEYTQVDESQVPGAVRFSSPRHATGQAVEWSYGSPGQRSEGSPGDLYACCVDRTEATTTYFRWVSR